MENKRGRNSELEREELLMKMQEKISAPLEWTGTESCKILDLKEQHYEKVLRLIKANIIIKNIKNNKNIIHHFFSEDPMCRSARLLEDPISTQAYLDQIRSWMKETNSLVAISLKTGRVVGAAILRINSAEERSNAYSRMQIVQGKVLRKLMDLKNELVKQADAFKQLNKTTLLRVYILCVHPSHRSRDLATSLLEACIEMANAMEIPGIIGMFTSGESQELASTVGFNVLKEIHYGQWKIENQIIFDNPGIGNYSAAFMGFLTPTIQDLMDVRKIKKLKEKEERARRRKYHR